MAYDTFGNYVPDNGHSGNSAFDEKVQNLISAGKQKAADLGFSTPPKTRTKNLLDGQRNLEQGVNGGSGYSVIGGQPVSNKDRIHNDYDRDEMGQLYSDLNDQRTQQDEDGFLYLLNADGSKSYLEDQNVDTSHIYGGFNKDGTLNKRGKAEYGGRERYQKGLAAREGLTNNTDYGYPAGPNGIDSNNLYMNWQLSQGNVEKAEGIGLGNTGNIKNRYMFDDGSLESYKKRQNVGGGASEYELNNDGTTTIGGRELGPGEVSRGRNIFDEQGFTRYKTVGDRSQVKFKPRKMMTDYEKTIYDMTKQAEAIDGIERYDNDGLGGQLADLGQASLASTAAGWVDAAATAVGRATGTDLDNIGLLGFDKKIDDYKDIEKMSKEFGVDKRRQAITNAEVEKATDDLYKDPSMKTAFKAALVGIQSAPEEIMKNIGESLSYLSPYTIAAQVISRTNNDRETYMKNNDGKAPEALHELGSLGSNAGAMLAEKLVLGRAFKGLGGALQKKIKNKFTKVVAAGSVRALESGGGEAFQEYIDQVQQEIFTMKDNKKSLLENFGDVATSEKAIKAAITGGMIGTGAHAAGEAVKHCC